MVVFAVLLLVCAGLGLYALAAFILGMRSLSQSRKPQDRALCPFCGYEIGMVNQPRCPECGQSATPELWAQWRRENKLAVDRAAAKLSAAVSTGVGAMLLGVVSLLCAYLIGS